MATIKEENYICIQGWMLSKLGLKGNQLLIYAIIYGFCQDGHSCFHGSLEYLQLWTNSTRQGVINVLKELMEKKLIRREDSYPNNKYFLYDPTMYSDEVNKVNNDVKKVYTSVNKVYNESKESLHNNIEDNIVNNIEDTTKKEKELTFEDLLKKQDKYKHKKETKSINKKKYIDYDSLYHEDINQILTYLDKTCGTTYMSDPNARQGVVYLIGKKLHGDDGVDPIPVSDFIKVIDSKYKEWGVYPKKFKNGNWSNSYLRPHVLFGNKMVEYIKQADLNNSDSCGDAVVVKKFKDRSNQVF